MSLTDRTWQTGLAALAAGTMLSFAPALADDFAGGSFEESSFSDAEEAPDTAPDPGGSTPTGFENGSFEEGSFGDEGGETEAEEAETAAQETVADDGFETGSFEESGSEPPGIQPAAQPAPEPEPEADTAAAQPDTETESTPTLEIDPQIYAYETRDYGVPGQSVLRNGQFHAPTPLELPGGVIVSTQGLVDAYLAGVEMIVIDVLGDSYGLPDAYAAPNLSSPGTFGDRTQQQAEAWLRNLTGGDMSYPIVVYCSDPMCWLSYNGSLRVIAAGYQNVYWYRGGIHAWEMAGLSLYPTGL
ncbi:MAG: rhodanese-like domain-containing protein [Roseovarius sp.]